MSLPLYTIYPIQELKTRISSTLIDKQGNLLEGAHVLNLDNKRQHTTTDKYGEFSLNEVIASDLIEITYQGKSMVLEAKNFTKSTVLDITNVIPITITSNPKTTSNNKLWLVAGFVGAIVIGKSLFGNSKKPKKVKVNANI